MTIKIESTNKAFSSLGGLHIYDQIFEQLCLQRTFDEILPSYSIATKTTSYEKFKALYSGFVSGADCLEDMDRLAVDPAFRSVNSSYVNASNTYGEYLRLFTNLGCKYLNEALGDNSMKLRKASHPKLKDFVLDIDSTSHVQHGEKMEGLEYNYKGEWCLDSIQAFDQLGYMYWIGLRPGATFTSNNAAEVIHSVFKKVPRKMARYARVDSGFCNAGVFTAFENKGVKFVAAMRENMYGGLIAGVKSWDPAKTLRFKDNLDCEIGETLYYTPELRKILRVIIIRALKPKEQRNTLFADARYDYFAFVTNLGSHEMRGEQAVRFYRGRGNAENFIKEIKYGFDMKHFPCQSLTANQAYALIGAFAYNVMRYSAFLLNQDNPVFSKAIRFRMVHLAVQVVRHGRDVIFRFNNHQLKEVEYWLNTIKMQFGYG